MTKILESLYGARASARAKLGDAADAVTRAKRFVDAAASKAHDLEQLAEQEENEHALKLAERFASGIELSPVHSRIQFGGVDMANLTEIRRDLSLKRKALANLEAARDAAQAQLAAAERAVVTAVDQLLADEITERARAVDRALNEAKRLGMALKYFAVAAEVNGALVPRSTLDVLNRLSLPLLDELNTPIDLAQSGDVPAYRDWTQRRAEMIAGTACDEPKAA